MERLTDRCYVQTRNVPIENGKDKYSRIETDISNHEILESFVNKQNRSSNTKVSFYESSSSIVQLLNESMRENQLLREELGVVKSELSMLNNLVNNLQIRRHERIPNLNKSDKRRKELQKTNSTSTIVGTCTCNDRGPLSKPSWCQPSIFDTTQRVSFWESQQRTSSNPIPNEVVILEIDDKGSCADLSQMTEIESCDDNDTIPQVNAKLTQVK
jgi:hypothetical protein